MSRRDSTKVRQGEDKLAVVKWRMGALCQTSEVEEKMRAYSCDSEAQFGKVWVLRKARQKNVPNRCSRGRNILTSSLCRGSNSKIAVSCLFRGETEPVPLFSPCIFLTLKVFMAQQAAEVQACFLKYQLNN